MSVLLARTKLWLFAVRDSFVILLPLTYLGVGAVIVQSLLDYFYQGAGNPASHAVFSRHLAHLIFASHGIYSLALAVVVSIALVGRLQADSPDNESMVNLATGSAALVCTFLRDINAYETHTLDHSVMLQSIVVGILVAELMNTFLRSRLFDRLHSACEPESTFYFSMRFSPPIILTCLAVFGLLQLAPDVNGYFGSYVDVGSQWVLEHPASQFVGGVFMSALSHGLWFLSIHGWKIVDTFAVDLFYHGPYVDSDLIWRPMFNAFVLIGGSGATLGAILAIEWARVQGTVRKLSRFALVPALFNVNEPILFGLPIILNPVFFLPFLIAPLVLWGVAYLALQTGFIEIRGGAIPWSTPPLLSGWLLTGSWRGVVLQVAQIVLSILIYLPFVRRDEAARIAQQNARLSDAIGAICSLEQAQSKVIHRRDELGAMARGLLVDLRRSMQSSGDIMLFYQPKHDRQGRLVGAEALLRWKHPRLGMVTPVVPVKLAEESMEINVLGLILFDMACACKAELKRYGVADSFVISVNVSPLQLLERSFYDNILYALDRHGLSPHEMEIEITESMALSTDMAVSETVGRLAQAGVKISMDDFGMGFSSILYMKRMELHAIKLDGSLTRHVLEDSVSADIITSVANLKRTQPIKIVAEYVETCEQMELLAELGCDVFQGYYYSKPLSREDFMEYVGGRWQTPGE